MALALAGCGVGGPSAPKPSICDGVSTDIGPCGQAPSFGSSTCESLAAEYGTALDRALLAVVRGPADLGGEAKSVRLIHAEAFVTTALTDRMVALGLIEQCKMPDFLDTAKAGFSAELKSTIGHALFDGQPDVTYEEFLGRLAKVMSGIGKRP
jgi:hypothetical protein